MTLIPGTTRVIPPLNRAAIPPGAKTRAPDPPVITTPAVAVPRVISSWVAATRICLVAAVPGAAFAGAGTTTCSKAKMPEMLLVRRPSG